MEIDPNKVINFAKLSWKELQPTKDYDVTLEVLPEVIKKHEEFVRCYIANDYDPDRVVRVMLNFKNGIKDLEPEGEAWHRKLSDCLKRLSRQYAATRR